MIMSSQLRISARPNNQITITKGNWKKALKEGGHLLGDAKPDRYQVARYIHAHKNIINGDQQSETFEDRLDRLYPPLDIIKKSQRSKKAPYTRLNSPKNFTRFSGQKVRESGAAISIVCGGDMRFAHEVTLTLPANTQEAFTALAAYSGYAINRLFQPIRRRYSDDCLWFFVWEYQKRGALHLHLCIYHPDETEGMFICTQLIEQWHKILEDISVLADTCMFTAKQKDRCTIRLSHQHHTAPIKKDVAAYFSKYAGKTESKESWYIQKYPVSRFWGSSRSVKRIVKENSLRLDYDYQGNYVEADRRQADIIEKILENGTIVSCSTYNFCVSSPSIATVKKYPKGRKIVNLVKSKVFAEGERMTIYVNPGDYQKVLEALREEVGLF